MQRTRPLPRSRPDVGVVRGINALTSCPSHGFICLWERWLNSARRQSGWANPGDIVDREAVGAQSRVAQGREGWEWIQRGPG